jgi:hypothetical protein
MAQQTAVEWLEERLNVYFKSKNNDSLWKIKSRFLQAKQMEKEQITESYLNACARVTPYGNYNDSAEQYYNETYSK